MTKMERMARYAGMILDVQKQKASLEDMPPETVQSIMMHLETLEVSLRQGFSIAFGKSFAQYRRELAENTAKKSRA